MAEDKISELPAATSVIGSDVVGMLILKAADLASFGDVLGGSSKLSDFNSESAISDLGELGRELLP